MIGKVFTGTLVALSGPESVDGMIPEACLSIQRLDVVGNRADAEARKGEMVGVMVRCRRSMVGAEKGSKAESIILSKK